MMREATELTRNGPVMEPCSVSTPGHPFRTRNASVHLSTCVSASISFGPLQSPPSQSLSYMHQNVHNQEFLPSSAGQPCMTGLFSETDED